MITYVRIYTYPNLFEGFHRRRITPSLVNSPLVPKGIASITSGDSSGFHGNVARRSVSFARSLSVTISKESLACTSLRLRSSELTLLNRATVRKPELWNNHRRCHGRVVIIVAAVAAVRRLKGGPVKLFMRRRFRRAHSYNTRSVQRSRVRARKNARRESIKQHVEEYNWSFLVGEITHSHFPFQGPGKKKS